MKTKEVTEVEVDTLTGDYVAVMNFTSDVVMTVERREAAFTSRYFSTEDSTLSGVPEIDVKVKKLKVGEAYRLHNINFGIESYELTQASKQIIAEFATYLEAYPSIKVAIHGHTDNIGSPSSNMTLSNNRAKSVYNKLVEEGIGAKRLSYRGFGETKPVESNSSKTGRAKNRRTEFVITGR
jgi:outer membrane protein OmpA-like peptidoglycan-associated protein